MAEEIKKLNFSKPLFILAVVLVAGQIGYWTTQAIGSLWNISGGNYPREISVTAQGKVTVSPDMAIIRLGVTSEALKVADAVKDNTAKMNAILTEVKNSGVAAEDIKTTNYSLTPRYDYLESRRVFRGYTLTQEVQVKVRDFSKIGDILEKSSAKGANSIGDLQFTIDDQTVVKTAALEDAIAKAKAKAQTLATASGLKLGKVITMYEDSGVMPYYGAAGAGYDTTMKLEAAVAPTVEPGQQEMTVNVTLVYRVK